MSSDPPIPAAVSLFSLGFATLFLELVLIRYLAGSIWNLGYFPNFVLIAVFVGMGVGFVFHHYLDPQRSRTVFTSSGALLLLLTLFVALFHPAVPGFDSNWGGEIGGELYFTAVPDTGVGGIWTFGVWFLFVVAVFAAISQRTAKLFSRFEPLVSQLDGPESSLRLVAGLLCLELGVGVIDDARAGLHLEALGRRDECTNGDGQVQVSAWRQHAHSASVIASADGLQ